MFVHVGKEIQVWGWGTIQLEAVVGRSAEVMRLVITWEMMAWCSAVGSQSRGRYEEMSEICQPAKLQWHLPPDLIPTLGVLLCEWRAVHLERARLEWAGEWRSGS